MLLIILSRVLGRAAARLPRWAVAVAAGALEKRKAMARTALTVANCSVRARLGFLRWPLLQRPLITREELFAVLAQVQSGRPGGISLVPHHPFPENVVEGGEIDAICGNAPTAGSTTPGSASKAMAGRDLA